MPRSHVPLKTDTAKGRAVALLEATLCCEREDMIHPVLGCRDTRYLLEMIRTLEERLAAQTDAHEALLRSLE